MDRVSVVCEVKLARLFVEERIDVERGKVAATIIQERILTAGGG